MNTNEKLTINLYPMLILSGVAILIAFAISTTLGSKFPQASKSQFIGASTGNQTGMVASLKG